ncbi:MAG TPA: DUF4340 domain-containing protein [Tepidisphaeraceae bacterium]|jgi:hypothetical protein
MNFKTTIFLIALLIIAGVTVYFVHQQPAQTTETAATTTKNLLSVSADDVAKISVTPADGQPLVLEHTGANWTITAPIQAKADTFTAGDLAREICALQSHAQVGTDVATGVDHPNYRVELTDKSGKTNTLNFGAKSEVGDNLYVRVNDQSQVDVVSADVQSYLDKQVNDYRDLSLITTTADTIQRVTIQTPTRKIDLSKNGGKWEMISPERWSTEPSATDDLLSTLTSLRAGSFVDHPLASSMYQFNKPQLVITYWNTAAGNPTTQPTQNTITFGGYDSVLKQNVFVQANGSIAKVPASTMDSLNKSPLDLRDKTLVDIDLEKVDQIELRRNLPAATQPTNRAASNVDLVIVRAAIPQATSKPSSQPAASQPSITWTFATDKAAKVNADNANDVLTSLHPLKVEKYVEKLPAPLPPDRFHLVITSAGKNYDFDFYATPANDGNATGSFNGTYFEVPNTFIDHLKLDFGWQNK